jgi:VLRF1 release factor-like protein
VAERRFIVRENIRRRFAPLEGTAGRSVYAGGEARFELPGETLTVRPPFGLAAEGEWDAVHVEPLLAAVAEDHLVGVLLVRLGGFAAGVFDGEQLVASKVGARNVHGRHRAGGSSANRFRRRREGQARVLVEAAAENGVYVLGRYRGRLRAVALGGDRTAVRQMLAANRELAQLAATTTSRFLTVPEPRRHVLERAIHDVYAVQVVTEAPS